MHQVPQSHRALVPLRVRAPSTMLTFRSCVSRSKSVLPRALLPARTALCPRRRWHTDGSHGRVMAAILRHPRGGARTSTPRGNNHRLGGSRQEAQATQHHRMLGTAAIPERMAGSQVAMSSHPKGGATTATQPAAQRGSQRRHGASAASSGQAQAASSGQTQAANVGQAQELMTGTGLAQRACATPETTTREVEAGLPKPGRTTHNVRRS